MTTSRKSRHAPRIRKAIQPTMDIPGVVARNEKYIQQMMELQAFLPQVTTDPDAIYAIGLIIEELGVTPQSLGVLDLKDKSISKKATQLLLILKKELTNLEDIATRKTLKQHMAELEGMATDLGLSRGSPRNIKETIARNFLGLQPQDVRSQGVAKTFLKESIEDMKVLFGADGAKMVQQKSEAGHAALNRADDARVKRKDHDEALQDDKDFEERKVDIAHGEALEEEKERNQKIEREEAHEEALKENEKRDSAVSSGTPFNTDAIREKELIHAQALDIEEDAERQREAFRTQEENKPKQRERVAEKIAAHTEDVQDDSVASEILDTVKAIHKLLEKEGKKKNPDPSKSEKEKTSKQEVGEKEEAILKIMKTLGYKSNDPEGRRLAEKAFEKGTLNSSMSTATPLEKVDVGEDHARALQTNENIDKTKAHEEAKAVNDRIEKHTKVMDPEKDLVRDKNAAHGMAITTNTLIDKNTKTKELKKGLIKDKEKAHEMAIPTNIKIDRRSAALQSLATKNQESSSTEIPPTTPTEATVEDSPSTQAPAITPEEPTEGGMSPVAASVAGGVAASGARSILGGAASGARSILGGARRVVGRVGGILGRVGSAAARVGGTAARVGAMGVGSSALATGAVAAGGLFAGWKIGKWANRRLGLQSRDERFNEAANTRLAEAGENAERTARERGFSSFAAMRSANRSRAQLQEQETRAGAVEGLERGSVEDRIQEPTTPTPTVPPVINNYNSPAQPPAQPPGNQTVFIRPVHPSFMRYLEKRQSRILFPTGAM